jgi:hypothetical protein
VTPFDEIVRKYKLTDARLVGAAIFVSAAEYWKMLDRNPHHFVRSHASPAGLNGFLAEQIEGRMWFLNNEVAGTGITVSTEPAIDMALMQVDSAEPRAWLVSATNRMRRNLQGFVVRDYDVATDTFDWVFGSTRWPRLMINSVPFPDDPMIGRTEDIPLAEFMHYLRDWYWERRRQIALGELNYD